MGCFKCDNCIECATVANNYIARISGLSAVDRLRDTLLMYLLLALLAYGAAKLVVWVASTEYHASPLVAIVMAVDPGLYLDPPRSAVHSLLNALDVPAYMVMVSSAFFLYVAVARILAPHAAAATTMARAFRAALLPLWAWVDACAAAMDGLLRAERARDSLLAMALAAYVTYLAIRLADVTAIILDHPDPPLAALRGALYAHDAIAVVPAGAYHALLRAMVSLEFLSMLGASPLLASLVSKTVVAACARLWRKL